MGWCMVAGCVLFPPWYSFGQGLELRWSGEEIRFSAPKLRFLQGPLLNRLHNGAPVPLTVQLFVSSDDRSNVIKRLTERMTLSYDLWEENIAVTPVSKSVPRTTHRTPAAAESACLNRLGLRAAELPAGRPLWFKVEVRPDLSDEEPRTPGTNLKGLVDLLSRPDPKPKPELKWIAEAYLQKLDDLKRPVERHSARLASAVP